SSRRRHTRSKRDWSSDVCSSDLMGLSFVLVACGDSSDEKETDTSNEKTETEETSSGSDQAQGTENEDAVYEIGETLAMESYEWEVPYQVTVKSVDVTRE